jgi:hypothetical protein
MRVRKAVPVRLLCPQNALFPFSADYLQTKAPGKDGRLWILATTLKAEYHIFF